MALRGPRARLLTDEELLYPDIGVTIGDLPPDEGFIDPDLLDPVGYGDADMGIGLDPVPEPDWQALYGQGMQAFDVVGNEARRAWDALPRESDEVPPPQVPPARRSMFDPTEESRQLQQRAGEVLSAPVRGLAEMNPEFTRSTLLPGLSNAIQGAEGLNNANEAFVNQPFREAAGLGTLGIKATQDPWRIVTAMQDAGVTDEDEPMEAVRKVARHYYENEELPVVTGLLEFLPQIASVTGTFKGLASLAPKATVDVAKGASGATGLFGANVRGGATGIENVLGSAAQAPGVSRAVSSALVNNAIPVAEQTQQTARMAAIIAQGTQRMLGETADDVRAAARAANEALPESLRLTGAPAMAQRGQVINPFSLGKNTDDLAKNIDEVGDAEVERGFAQNLRTNPQSPEALRQAMGGDTPTITYEPRPTQPLADWARETVALDRTAAVSLIHDASRITGREVALASELAPLLGTLERSENDLLYTALVKTSKGLTEAGQTSQAASIYGRLSPEGIVDYSIRAIERVKRDGRHGGHILKNASRVIVEEAGETAKLTAQELKVIDDLRKAGDLEAATKKLYALNQRINKAEDIAQTLTEEAGAATLDDATQAALERLGMFKADEAAYKRALAREQRALNAEEALDARGISDLGEETAAANERATMFRNQAREFATAERRAEKVSGQAQAIAAANRVTVGDLPALSAAYREHAAEEAAKVAAYNQSRQAMINAEATRIKLDNLMASGNADSWDEIAERSVEARGFLDAYNKSRQAMVDAEAKVLRLEGRIAAGAAPDLPTVTAKWSDATRKLAELRQYEKDLAYLTDKVSRVVEKKIPTIERETISRAKALLKRGDIQLERDVAVSFLNRAKNLKAETDPAKQYLMQKDLMTDIARFVPPSKWDLALDIYNIPRTIKASFDMSMPLRQGILAIGSPAWRKSWQPMFKAALDGDTARLIDAQIHTRPLAKRAEEAGLFLAELGGGMTRGEEGFVSKALGMKLDVPTPLGKVNVNAVGRLQQASERNAVTFLNKLRSDMFDDLVGKIEGKWGQELSEQDAKDIAQYINWATGRGTLAPNKELDRALGSIGSMAFFSPRNWASRVEAPLAQLRALASLTPGAQLLPGHIAYSRPVAVALSQEALKTTAILTSVLAAAKLGLDATGQGTVGTDPRNADFGKIVVGPMHIDLLGGESQNFRYLAQIATGIKTTSIGKEQKIGRDEAIGSLVRSKLNPALGQGWDVVKGRDFSGKPTTVEGVLMGLLAPMIAEGIAEGVETGGPAMGAASAGLQFFGAGVNTYETTRDIQDKIAQEQGAKDWNSLKPEQQRAARQDPRFQKAIEDIAESRAPLSEPEVIQSAREQFEEYKKQEVEQFAKALPGRPREGVRKSFDAMNARLRAAADATINSIKVQEAMGERLPPGTIEEAFKRQYMAIQPVELPDGTVDFKTSRKEQQAVIDAAGQYGIKPEYFESRGADKALDFPDYGNPAVNEAYKELWTARQTLRPYWELTEKAIANTPAYAKVKEQTDKLAANFRAKGMEKQAQAVEDKLYKELEPLRDLYRLKNPDVDKALTEWYGYTPIKEKLSKR